MLHTFYKLKIIGINSMNKSNKFIFSASGISKESTFKSYQNKIKFLKFPSTILTILILKNKLFCQTEKQVDEKKVLKNFIVKNSLIVTSIRLFFNIILLMAILFVHLMFPDSRWIKNVPDSCASAPISRISSGHTSGYIFLSEYVVYVGKFHEHTRTALSRNQFFHGTD